MNPPCAAEAGRRQSAGPYIPVDRHVVDAYAVGGFLQGEQLVCDCVCPFSSPATAGRRDQEMI